MDYLDFIKNENNRNNIARQTAKYIAERLRFSKFVLCKHYPTPQPIEVLANYDTFFNLSNWVKSCKKNTPEIKPLSNEYSDPYHYVFLNQDYTTDASYFLVSTERPNQDVLKTIAQWDKLNHFTCRLNLAIAQHQTETQGNLISQLLHDVQSLMRAQSDMELPATLANQLKYQQRVNDDLLFFIRPVDILNSDVPLKALLTSALQLVEFDLQNFKISYETTVSDISVDSEMFARAFNEIVLNALEAVEFDVKKCKIAVKQIQSPSPLISKDWLKLMITDFGPGISKDYLTQVREPFFTTRKNEGHSGFGLTITDKILTAMGGYLAISSEKRSGTEVCLYLPLKYD